MGEFPTFTEFYRALHERDPFPWQRALAEHVAARGWPDTVDIPTGLGKTTTMTVGVWELARQTHLGGPRTMPLRVVHIVDRTTLVDQTHADLLRLHSALHEAVTADAGDPVGVVARTLSETFGTPLVIGHAHGSDHDEGWTQSATVPAVVTMTAHQAVSRILFRGFGVSPGMSPIHAGLLGADSLLLLDEPHLSAAALYTLRAATRLQQEACTLPVPHARVVDMGATVPGEEADIFRITRADYDHPVAGARLAAQKTLEVLTTDTASDKAVEKALVTAAKAALRANPDQTVAVVCNTVATARAVHAELTTKVTSDALLVTSRVRAHERAAMNTGLAQPTLSRLVVATQTVEAGVDMSVPVMITETSDWASLVQRIGRVNRYGTTPGRVVLISPPTGEARPATKSIYGTAAEALATLVAQLPTTTDVSSIGLQNLRQQHPDLVESACTGRPPAPTLTAEMLPTLAHTNPRPAADIELQRFITGVPERTRVEDVTVAWRSLCEPAAIEEQPPSPEELVSVPLAAVNYLLQGRLRPEAAKKTAPPLDDADSAAEPGNAQWSDTAGQVVVHTGGSWRTAHRHDDLAPGSRVVLHADLGGHDATGWNLDSTEPVLDLCAYYRHQRGQWWLLTPTALHALHTLGTVATEPDPAIVEKLTEAEPDETDELAEELLPAELGPLEIGPAGPHGLWVRPQPAKQQSGPLVLLEEHARHVAERVRQAATRLALPDGLTATLEWAGYRHDDGKDHHAFQARLGADPHGEPLAKQHPHRTEVDGILPPGWRHESASAHRALNDGAPDLLVHLVAAHHGWARPLLPAADGPEQALPTAVRFTELNARWGPWGLAWLETLLRLADHQASATPETGHPVPSAPMPRNQFGAPLAAGVAREHRLAGLPADTHLHWWSALGVLAAATDLDTCAALRFDAQPAGSVPVLITTAELDAIAEHVMELRTSADRIAKAHPGLGEKHEKLRATDARATLAALDDHSPNDRTTATALLDDTQIPDTAGRVEPRVPWHHGNSSLIQLTNKHAHTARQISAALISDTPDQHDDAKMFGLLPIGVDPAPTTGIAHTGRSVLLPLVLAATCRLPATGSNRTAGTTADRRRVLPMPRNPVRWSELVALMQTLPALQHRPWADCGIDSSAWRERPAQGKSFGWIGD